MEHLKNSFFEIFKSLLNSKKVDQVLNRPVMMVAIGVILGLLAWLVDGWNLIEPTTGLATLLFAASAWYQTRKAKEAYYEDCTNADGRHVVALEVGRPISEAVKDKFGHCDILVRVQEVIGSSVLTSNEDYEKVARAVYSACARCQNQPIDLIVSGPNGLLLIVGQMLGLDRFRVKVWQYYNGTYQEVPRPTRDWLEHRD